MMAPFWTLSEPSSASTDIALIFCASYAVKPTIINIPIYVVIQYSIELFKNIFTTEAITIPISPIIKKPPKLVKSRFVVAPYNVIAPKVPPVTKNVVASDDVVYAKNTADNVTPVRAEYPVKTNVAVAADIFSIRTESHMTNPS